MTGSGKINSEAPEESGIKFRDASSDYGDGYRRGFEDARLMILRAALAALEDGRAVRRAILSVQPPAPMREPTGLEYRAG